MNGAVLVLLIGLLAFNVMGEQPCGDFENIRTCVCKNGRTYYRSGAGSVEIRCLKDVNPVQSCNCADGTTWEPSWEP